MNHPRRWLVGSSTALAMALWPPASTPAHAQKDDEVFQLNPVEISASWMVVAPNLKDAPKPPYPESARKRDVQGNVLLLIRVQVDGTVGEVKVRRSSGDTSLDSAASNGARMWTFVPARRGPNPVEAWVEVPVEFKLR